MSHKISSHGNWHPEIMLHSHLQKADISPWKPFVETVMRPLRKSMQSKNRKMLRGTGQTLGNRFLIYWDSNEWTLNQWNPKDQYERKIKSLIKTAVLKHFNELKITHRKLDLVSYTELKLQTYIFSSHMDNNDKSILYFLRSHYHMTKFNFKKLHKNHL